MYKCTECGLEFENKPDYCDCGNDEFVLTVEEKPEVKTEPDPVSAEEKPVENIQQHYESEYSTYTHESHNLTLPVSPYAIVIFVLCIILSLLVLFAWKPVETTTETVTEIIEKAETKTIPPIDKLWKNPSPQTAKTETVKSTPQQEPAKKVTTVPLNKKPVRQKTVQQKTAAVNKPVVKQQSKPAANTNKTQQKPAANTTQAANKIQDDVKKAQEEAANKALEAKQKAEAEALAAAEKAKKTAQAKQELYSYKINLRNTIGQKIDFTRVIGDGECSVTFKIDQNGRLINRNFAKQSSNITLNNAVYNAVKATPSFYPPPAGYSNETLRLNVSFTNGNFAITLE